MKDALAIWNGNGAGNGFMLNFCFLSIIQAQWSSHFPHCQLTEAPSPLLHSDSLPSDTLCPAKLNHDVLYCLSFFPAFPLYRNNLKLSITTPPSLSMKFYPSSQSFFHEAILILLPTDTIVLLVLEILLHAGYVSPFSAYLHLFYSCEYFYLICLMSWVKFENISYMLASSVVPA